jgi:hypothetical protein
MAFPCAVFDVFFKQRCFFYQEVNGTPTSVFVFPLSFALQTVAEATMECATP